MNYIKIFVLTLIVWFAQRSIASKIPSDFTSISTLLQSRIKRDNDYEVKCHQSGTGMYYFIIDCLWYKDIGPNLSKDEYPQFQIANASMQSKNFKPNKKSLVTTWQKCIRSPWLESCCLYSDCITTSVTITRV